MALVTNHHHLIISIDVKTDPHGQMAITEDHHPLGEMTTNTEIHHTTETVTITLATDTQTVKASDAGEETNMINTSTPTKTMITLKTVLTNSTKMTKVTNTITKKEEHQEKDFLDEKRELRKN